MAVHIFTRDLRIIDNNALNVLSEKNLSVYPVFIFTPEQVKNNRYKSDNAVQFMVESLKDLDESLQKKLGLFYGELSKIVQTIINKVKPHTLSITKDYTPYAVKREKILSKICKEKKIQCLITEDYCLNYSKDIKLYQKYTPYKNTALKTLKKSPNPKTSKIKFAKAIGNFTFTKASKLYTSNNEINLHGGRTNGLKQMSKIKNQKQYNKTRNDLDKQTSELSAFIKFGCISIREVYWYIRKHLGPSNLLISQLIWRDFYFQLGSGFPHVLKGKSLKEKYDKIKWDNNPTKFKKWKEGKTGFPIVDAGMRQLNSTGFMHNRARLITASFLVKTLLIDWRLGERYYATQLYDYDPLVNNGNWQWVSSSGADSQPYFRIFNPWLQSKKHDPECKYIKKWVPELKNIEPQKIHNWYRYHKKDDYEGIYLDPIVEFDKQKKKVLSVYKKIY